MKKIQSIVDNALLFSDMLIRHLCFVKNQDLLYNDHKIDQKCLLCTRVQMTLKMMEKKKN